MFFHISTHFTATCGIPFSLTELKSESFKCRFGVEPRNFTSDFSNRLSRPLRPVIPINACTLRITAAAGTELAGASLPSTLKLYGYSPYSLVPRRKNFTTRRPSSFTRRRFVRLSPIAKDSRLQPPVGVWAVLSPSVGGQSLNPPRRLSLGELLPHQLADIPWASL